MWRRNQRLVLRLEVPGPGAQVSLLGIGITTTTEVYNYDALRCLCSQTVFFTIT